MYLSHLNSAYGVSSHMTTKTASPFGSTKSLTILSTFLLGGAELDSGITRISEEEFSDLVALANSNHVLMRGLEVFLQIVEGAGDWRRAEWAATAIKVERARIENAISFLHKICCTFELEGHDIAVIKSLDHWPDLGSDLDLYTNTKPAEVIGLMRHRFDAKLAPRSWGDRLACKWNFVIPGLPEAVEIHMGRLGQTGEQLVLASRLPSRARSLQFGEYTFRVPSASDRLMVSTLQRMYRHFYFRLCDVIDSGELAVSGDLNYHELRSAAQAADIWEGVATYLVIVSDYVSGFREAGLDLPEFVITAARFGGNLVYFGKDFLRIPILPQSAELYRLQLAGLLRKKELHSSARLGLLPWLATAAAVGQKITGSD